MTGLGKAMRVATLCGLCAATGCLAPAKQSGPGGTGVSTDGGTVPAGDMDEPTGAAALVGETFPAPLLLPWTGAPSTYYDNNFIRYPQLKAKVLSIFNDTWVRNGTDEFAARIALFGGVDFMSNTNEARTATPDFLLALDDMAKDVCAQASTNKAGPFASIDPTAVDSGSALNTKIAALYQAILYRPVATQETADATSLLNDLVTGGSTPQDAWAGLCEGLVHSQDFLFTMAPSISTLSGMDKSKVMLVRIAQDVLGRPPTSDEINSLTSGQKQIDNIVDDYLASTDFRDWFYYNMQVRTQTTGTDESNEPARLWAYIAASGKPIGDLLSGEYTVDTTFTQQTRDASYGKTGILTMEGFIDGKPGLPHYTYAARVFTDLMGVVFNESPAIVAMRIGATAASTVTPSSICFTCHQMLTPLATQRSRWYDDGTYHTTDANGATIDDSDQNMVTSYQFKGEGIEAFGTQAVKKEAFIRQMINAEYLILLGRPMRAWEDERVIYKQLWDVNTQSQGNIKAVIKAIVTSPTYQGT